VAPVEDVEIPLWLFAEIAESPEGKVVDKRIDPFVTRTVMRIPAGKFDVLRGLSLTAYTLFQTPEEFEAILGPLEVPTIAFAESANVISARIRGETTSATTKRAVIERRDSARENRKILGIRKRISEVRMCEMPPYKRHHNYTDVLDGLSRGSLGSNPYAVWVLFTKPCGTT
jgi:hypothetical protein